MAGENSIVVVCDCGKKLKAPATSAGKKARCPACSSILVLTPTVTAKTPVAVASQSSAPLRKVSTAAPRPVPAVAQSDEEDGDLGALYDLAAQANSAPVAATVARCPQCRTNMEEGAVLCTNCGFDTRTGKALVSAPAGTPVVGKKAATIMAARKANKQIDLMAPQGSFVAGLAMSAAYALTASVLWIIVAWFTGYAIGFIAILIGGAAGAGMKIGQKGFSSTGGSAAAGMTVCAILFAKLVVVELLLSRQGFHRSIFDLNTAKLCLYLFSPISLVFMVIGMGAAFRTANGSVSG